MTEELFDSSVKIKKNAFGTILHELDNELEMDKETFSKMRDEDYDKEKEDEIKNEELMTAYSNIIELLKKYCDLKEEYYPIISTWIIGTYLHEQFMSYPYLFLNAMRGSGKSRAVKLITDLSKDGDVQMSMTEAVLFRSNGTLGIDEFESIGRKGNENLRELLNASYKKGTKVKRVKEKRTPEGTQRELESFDVYRPIVMANIWGMEEVLGDRCISLVLNKSNNAGIIKLQEIWKDEELFKKTKEILKGCSLCSVDVVNKCYQEWNNYIVNIYNTTYTTQTTYTTHYYTKLFKLLNLMDLNGRDVELCFPLFLIAYEIGENVLKQLHQSIKHYMEEKKEDQFAESKDISFIDFVSQEHEENFIQVKEVCKRFKEFIQYEGTLEDNWLNPNWVGKALKRLDLRKAHKRLRGGISVILNIEKAQEKIQMFK